jgi:hypothetical protein
MGLCFFGYEFFDQATMERILTPVEVVGKMKPYGLGWGICPTGGEILAGHTGGMFGFRTLYEHQLNRNITIIMLTNTGDDTPLMEIRTRLNQLLTE